MGHRRIPWATLAPVVAAFGIAVAMWALRPLTPFEWDEVLFMRALDHYDIAAHSPHPPGYPVFVAAGHLTRTVLGDPFASLQAVSILATLGALIAIFVFVRRAGERDVVAWTAALVLLSLATVLFHAATAYSDVLGMAVTALALLALVAALDRPGLTTPAAALGALALGVRPQLLAALLPAAAAVTLAAVRARRWRTLAAAAGAGVAVTAACWLPAIALTGPARFFAALADHRVHMVASEHGYRLLSAPFNVVAASWLLAPFGTPQLALGFWLLVVLGAALWWRRGQRRVVLVAAGTAVSYIVLASLTHNMTTTSRYILPALPPLAVLAAGVTTAARRPGRLLGISALALLAAANVVWVAPALALRAREPAPLWACLEKLRTTAPRQHTRVICDGAFTPHVEYVLFGPRGRVPQAEGPFAVEEAKPSVLYRPGFDRILLFVFHEPIPGAKVVAQRSWRSKPLRQLTRGRYDRCTVSLVSPDGPLWYSPDFRLNPDGIWVQSGRIALAPGGPPRRARVRTLGATAVITQRGQAETVLPPDGELIATLWPDGAPSLTVAGAGGEWARIAPLELLDGGVPSWLPSGGPALLESFVPVAAHVAGRYGALWVTDLVLGSPDGSPQLARVEFIPRESDSDDGGGAAVGMVAIPEGTPLRLGDVVRTQLSTAGAGSLRVTSTTPLVVSWRTYDARAAVAAWPPLLPALSREGARTRGAFEALPSRPGRGGIRSAVSIVDASGKGSRVTLTLTAGSRTLDRTTRRLRPFGCLNTDIPAAPGDLVRVEFSASEPVLALATVTENGSGAVSLVPAG